MKTNPPPRLPKIASDDTTTITALVDPKLPSPASCTYPGAEADSALPIMSSVPFQNASLALTLEKVDELLMQRHSDLKKFVNLKFLDYGRTVDMIVDMLEMRNHVPDYAGPATMLNGKSTHRTPSPPELPEFPALPETPGELHGQALPRKVSFEWQTGHVPLNGEDPKMEETAQGQAWTVMEEETLSRLTYIETSPTFSQSQWGGRTRKSEPAVTHDDLHLMRKSEALRKKELTTEAAPVDLKHRLAIMADVGLAVVIILNIVQIAISQDHYKDHEVWSWLEKTFISFYCLECLLKLVMVGFRDYFAGPLKYWNWFDFALVAMSIVDQILEAVLSSFSSGNTLGILKVVRLCRLARLLRVIRFKMFDQLKNMIMGVIAGVRVLFWALVLLFSCFFLLGLIIRILIGDSEEEMKTLPWAMFTAFHCFAADCDALNGEPLLFRLYDSYGFLFVCSYSFAFIFITVGIFNLITATFIENVISSSEGRRLEELGRTRDKVFLKIEDTLEALIFRDPDYEDTITATKMHSENPDRISLLDIKRVGGDILVPQDKFSQWLKLPEMDALIEEAGIDHNTKDEWFDILDADSSGELEIHELINGLMQLRGPITKTDVVGTRLKVEHVCNMVESLVSHFGIDGEELQS